MDAASRKEAIQEACNENCECFYGEPKERVSTRDWYAWLAIAVVALALVYLGYLA